MAVAVTSQLATTNPIVLAVMIGGLIPAGGLLSRLGFPLEVDYVHATRYRGSIEGRDVEWRARPHAAIKDRVVLIVDDIFDEGITLSAVSQYCREQGAAQVLTSVLVEKQHDRKRRLPGADFTGLRVEDRYVFGSGMD